MTHYELQQQIRSQLPVQPVDAPKGFYVYYIRETSDVVYVGKGKGFRAWEHFKIVSKLYADTVQRRVVKNVSPMYTTLLGQIVRGKKVTVEIFMDDLTEDKSLEVEKDMIHRIGRIIDQRGKLYNLAEGGIGVGSSYYGARASYREHEADKDFVQVNKQRGRRNRPSRIKRKHMRNSLSSN